MRASKRQSVNSKFLSVSTYYWCIIMLNFLTEGIDWVIDLTILNQSHAVMSVVSCTRVYSLIRVLNTNDWEKKLKVVFGVIEQCDSVHCHLVFLKSTVRALVFSLLFTLFLSFPVFLLFLRAVSVAKRPLLIISFLVRFRSRLSRPLQNKKYKTVSWHYNQLLPRERCKQI